MINFQNPDGKEIGRVIEALISAFNTETTLKRMLRTKLDKKLDELVKPASLRDVIYDLIEIAVAENWLKDLLEAAISENPNNIKLNKLLGLEVKTENNENQNIKEESASTYPVETGVMSIITLLEDLYETFTSRSPKYEWLDASMKKFESIKKKWDDRRFQVAIMALMKSGKSTLLNSWIGYEFLPSGSLPETMRVIQIRHTPNESNGVLFQGDKIIGKGVEEIRKCIKKLNAEQRKGQNAINKIRLDVEFSTLRSRNLNGYGFDFIDTPGVNEYGVGSLPSKVKRIVNNSDVVIYLLDFTKLRSSDEKNMLSKLKKWKSEILNKLGSRLFFVVNKIDMINRHDRENGFDEESIRGYVKNILKENIDLDVDPKNIIPVSSKFALLSQAVSNEIATEGQLIDFKKEAFGRVGAKRATKERCLKAAPQFFKDSGFGELEDNVLETIYQNRSFILIDSIVHDLIKLTDQVSNNLEVSKATLLSELENVEALKNKVSLLIQDLKSLEQDFILFKKKANKEVEDRFDVFRKGINKLVNKSFQKIKGVAAQYPLFKFFTDRFGLTVFEIKGTNWDDFQISIQAMHSFVVDDIEKKFEELIQRLVTYQYKIFMEFRDDLTTKSAPFIQKIEREVNQTLNIKIRPNNINFHPLSVYNFLENIGIFLDDITSVKTKSNMGFFASMWNAFLRRTGLGGKEEQIYDEYTIRSSDYMKIILNEINPIIEEAEVQMISYIDSKYLNTINDVSGRITDYANQYVDIIEKEIQMRKSGLVDIKKRVNNLEEDIVDISYINEQLMLFESIKKEDIINLEDTKKE